MAACSQCSSTRTTRAARSPAASSTGARRSRVSAGAYLFSDYCQGDVRALRVRDGQVTEERTFDAHVDQLVAFAEDADGEVYALSLLGGIYRLDAAG